MKTIRDTTSHNIHKRNFPIFSTAETTEFQTQNYSP